MLSALWDRRLASFVIVVFGGCRRCCVDLELQSGTTVLGRGYRVWGKRPLSLCCDSLNCKLGVCTIELCARGGAASSRHCQQYGPDSLRLTLL